MKNNKIGKIIFEAGLQPLPQPHEIRVAKLLAEYYREDVVLLRRGIDRTADLKILGKIWELKSPKGNSKKTIENNLRDASKQSLNIVLDLGRTKMDTNRAIISVKHYIGNEENRHIKRVIVVSKGGKIIDIL